MDTIQVTETAYKEHHPEIFSTPFITIRYDFEFLYFDLLNLYPIAVEIIFDFVSYLCVKYKRWSLSLFEYCQNSVS